MSSQSQAKKILFAIITHPEDKPLTNKYISEILLQPVNNTFGKIFSDITIKSILTGIGAFIGFFIYENTLAILILVSFVLIDWITGIIAAIKSGNFNSAKFRVTVIKILIYLLIVSLFHSLEHINALIKLIQLDTLAATYLAITEIISILENITRITTVKMPPWLLKKLRSFQESGRIGSL